MKQFYFKSKLLILLVFVGFYFSNKAQEGRLPTTQELEIKLNLQKLYLSGARNGQPNHLMTTGPMQDCDNAIPVCQQTYSQATSYTGHGSIQEVNGTCLSTQETNSVWYTFTVQNSGTFTFLLNTANDYDFALYDISTIGCVGVPGATPIRCNYSATYGNTGLTLPTQAGNLSYNASQVPTMAGINVTAGQTFALIIDNYSANSNGYTITFGGSAQIFDNTPPTLGALSISCNPNSFNINFSEPVQCASLAANGSDFTITGPGGNIPVTGAVGNLCSSGASFTNLATVAFNNAGLTTGIYTVTINSGTDGNTILDKCNNAMSTSQTVTFQYLGPVSIAATSTAVCAGTPVTFTLTGDNGAVGAVFSWAPVSASTNTLTVNPVTSTTYIGSITYGGCTKSATQVVTVIPPPVVSVNPANVSLCSGTTNITASSTMGGSVCSTCSYTWSGGSSQVDNNVPSSTITNVGAGTYSVTVSASGTCVGNTAVSTISILSPAALPACDIIYVTPSGGGNGLTPASPTDIANALTLAACNSIVIKMQIGQYSINGPLNVGSYVTMEGGYNSTFTLKTSSKIAPTSLNGTFPNEGTQIIRTTTSPEGSPGNQRLTALNVTGGSSYFRFQDFMILVNNPPAGSRISNYGIYVGNACHDYNIVRCLIDAGVSNGSNGADGVIGGDGAAGNLAANPPGLSVGGAAGAGGTSLGNAGFLGGNGGSGSTGTNNFTAGNAGSGGGLAGGGGIAPTSGDRSDACGILGFDFPTSSGGPGGNGIAGGNGVNGAAAAPAPGYSGGYYNIGGDGNAGINGGAGGGGGGGGGGAENTANTSSCGVSCGADPGLGGSGGGGGGGGGTGGGGGIAAGGAFGIFSVLTGVNSNIIDCNVSALAGTAGTGGAGKAGGAGGAGGPSGFAVECVSAGVAYQGSGLAGGGGAGGAGGSGGSGTAGSSGASCLICDLNGTTLNTLGAVTNYTLATQTIITVDNLSCDSIPINHTNTIGGASSWTFGSGSNPTTAAVTPAATTYTVIGRHTVSLNANNYTDFNNTLINPPSRGNILASATVICPGTATFASSVAGTLGLNYSWSVSPAATIGTANTATTSITFANAGATAITYTVTLTLISNCCGTLVPLTTTITVNPIPASPTAVANTICIGGIGTFTATAPSGVTFSWYDAASSGTLLGTGNTYSISPVLIPYTVYLQASNSGGCLSPIVPVVITPTAVPAPTVVPNISCDTGIVSVGINPVTGVTNYNWYSDAGGTILVQSNNSLNYAQDINTTGGCYTVFVQSTIAGCTSSGLVPVSGCVSATPILIAPVIVPNDTICINSAFTITPNPSGGNGTFTYAWSPVGGTANSISQTLPASTAYNVVISSGGCSKMFNFPMIVRPYPKDTIAPASLTCLTNTITLDGSGSGAGLYNWTTTGGTFTSVTNTNTVTINGPGVYFLWVTDPITTCVSKDSVTITAPVLPTALINVPTVVCSPQTITLNDSTSSTGVSISYSWTTTGGTIVPPANTASAVVSASGVYSLTVSDSNTGCSKTASVTVTVNPSPLPPVLSGTVTSPVNECQGSPAVTLGVTPAGTSIPVWYVGTTYVHTGTTFTPGTSTVGTTIYTVIDSATVTGCKDTSASNTLTITVNIVPLPIAPVLTAPTGTNNIYCQGSPIPLTVSTGTTIPTPLAVWYSGTTVVNVGSTFNPPVNLPAGTYTYSVIDSIPAVNGCINAPASANTLTLTLVVSPLPSPPTLSAPTGINNSYCQGLPTPLTVSTGTTIPTPLAVWYSGTTVVNVGSTFNPPVNLPAGTYTFSVIDSIPAVNGCVNASASANTLTLTLVVNPLPIAPVLTAPTGMNNAYCQGSPTPLTVNTGTTIPTPLAVWYNGNTIVNVGSTFNSNLPAGTYTYSVIDSIPAVNGCINAPASANTLTLTLIVYNPPTANAAGVPDSSNCGLPTGGVHGVSASGGTGSPYHYQWYNGSAPIPGDTLATLTNVGIGTYSVLITDANGCAATGGVTTFTVASAIPVIAGFTPSIQLGNAPLAVTFTNTSTGATTYTWSFGANTTTSNTQNTSYTYNAAGTYTVILTASNGNCADTASAIIIVDVPTTIIIPNVFSPNGDNLNDQFYIACTGMRSLNCDIFNRWGQKVYTLTGPNQAWDGKLNNGNAATEGTYFYMLTAVGYDNKTYTYQGPLTLVK